MRIRFRGSLPLAALLTLVVAAAGCVSREPMGTTTVDAQASDTFMEVTPHDCLPGFDARAASLLGYLRQSNEAMGKGWALRLEKAEDFEALESLCIDLSVALDRDVVMRTWRGSKFKGFPDLRASCVDLRTILADDRWPPSGALYHPYPEGRGWILQPPDLPSVPGADDLFRAAKEALDM